MTWAYIAKVICPFIFQYWSIIYLRAWVLGSRIWRRRGIGTRSARWECCPSSRRSQRTAWMEWSKLGSGSLLAAYQRTGLRWLAHSFQRQHRLRSRDPLKKLLPTYETYSREGISKHRRCWDRSRIYNGAIDDWSQDTGRDLCDDFTKEVGTNRVHIIVDFSQEHRSLIGKDKDDVLDRVEGDCHGHKEQGAITVLNTLDRTVTVLEEDNSENGGDDCDNQLDIGGLG